MLKSIRPGFPARLALAFFLVLLLGLLALLTSHRGLAQEAFTPTRFSVELAGEGPDVILIPGLSTPRDVWRPTADRLSAHYRLHILQVRGFGEPAGPNADGPVLQPMVEELARYIAANDLDHPVIVGHSLGGLTAMMLAEAHPELAGQLVIVDALPWFGTLTGATSVDMIEPQAAALSRQIAARYGTEVPAETIAADVAGQAMTEAAQARLREWAALADERVTATLFYEDMTTDMRDRIGAITAPVTVIYPWSETYPTQAQAGAFYPAQYAALPTARFIGVGPAGHFVMLDQPEAFHEALEAVLAAD